MAANNNSLGKAKKAKKDEFYTQLPDIEKELRHYEHHFKDKVVLCNCDDPKVSNFFVYFVRNFKHLGLKRLITTCYKNNEPTLFSNNDSEQAVYLIYDGGDDNNPDPVKVSTTAVPLKGDGDFRSMECIELLKQADIVVTNPPFSLFREYVAQLIRYEKKFLIIGNQNAITYKEIFPLIRNNKLWLGYGFTRNCAHFINKSYEDTATDADHREGMIRVSGVMWFTNMDVKQRHEEPELFKNYTPEAFPHYDNFDAINVDKAAEIPLDYSGMIGVPITYLQKHCPEYYDILYCSAFSDESNYGCGSLKINGKKVYARLIIKKKQL